MNALVFDIETAPDVEAGRLIHGLDGEVSDEDVVRAMRHLQHQKSGTEFLPLHLHRVVAIAAVYENNDEQTVKVASYGTPESSESDLVSAFFKSIEIKEPRLVSWNGLGFDLPVLNYRALLHGVAAPKYWDSGEKNQRFRFANYQNRYHAHKNLDLMDKLARSQRGAGLNDICRMLRLPGKSGMSGDKVCDAWLAGKIDDIRAYCETDALNTYLVYLQFERISGNLDEYEHEEQCDKLRECLGESEMPHLQQFLQDWQAGAA